MGSCCAFTAIGARYAPDEEEDVSALAVRARSGAECGGRRDKKIARAHADLPPRCCWHAAIAAAEMPPAFIARLILRRDTLVLPSRPDVSPIRHEFAATPCFRCRHIDRWSSRAAHVDEEDARAAAQHEDATHSIRQSSHAIYGERRERGSAASVQRRSARMRDCYDMPQRYVTCGSALCA